MPDHRQHMSANQQIQPVDKNAMCNAHPEPHIGCDQSGDSQADKDGVHREMRPPRGRCGPMRHGQRQWRYAPTHAEHQAACDQRQHRDAAVDVQLMEEQIRRVDRVTEEMRLMGPQDGTARPPLQGEQDHRRPVQRFL